MYSLRSLKFFLATLREIRSGGSRKVAKEPQWAQRELQDILAIVFLMCPNVPIVVHFKTEMSALRAWVGIIGCAVLQIGLTYGHGWGSSVGRATDRSALWA